MAKEIELTKGYVALVDDKDCGEISKYKWFANSQRNKHYAARMVSQPNTRSMRVLMAREIMDAPDDMVVDHINGNTMDNRRCNLRLCTSKENSQNKHAVWGQVAYKGVYYIKQNKRYVAHCNKDGAQAYMGSFDTPEEAALVYNDFAREVFGEFAKLNEVYVG